MGDDFEDEDEEAGEEEPPPAAAAAAQPPAASPAQVQAAAEARLPPEPPGSEGVRIGEARGSGCWEARSRADSQVCVPFAGLLLLAAALPAPASAHGHLPPNPLVQRCGCRMVGACSDASLPMPRWPLSTTCAWLRARRRRTGGPSRWRRPGRVRDAWQSLLVVQLGCWARCGCCAAALSGGVAPTAAQPHLHLATLCLLLLPCLPALLTALPPQLPCRPAGAAPLADRQQTLEAAALHGAMLVVKWD